MKTLFLLKALLLCGLPAFGGSISYLVTVNTAGLAGGFLAADLLSFGTPALVEATITGFSPVASLSTDPADFGVDLAGTPTGRFDTTLVLDNAAGIEGFFQRYTYGNTFSFLLHLAGDGVAAGLPNGDVTTFSLVLLDGNFDEIPGQILQIDVNGDANTVSFVDTRVTLDEVPEPASWMLLGGGLLAVALQKRRRSTAS